MTKRVMTVEQIDSLTQQLNKVTKRLDSEIAVGQGAISAAAARDASRDIAMVSNILKRAKRAARNQPAQPQPN